jgi:hypothetical protein
LIKVIVTYSFRHWRSIMTDKNKKSTGAFTEDAENLLKEFWGKVVEYASLGAEEASKVSSTAKTRVDIETLKFKRGKLAKILGERFYDEWLKDSGVAATGTRDLLRQIKRLDADVKKLEKQIAKAQPKTRSKPSATAKAKPETKKRAGSKASTEKKPTKKQSTKKTSTTTKPKTEG